ncbi:MAG TPA: FGGY family carbohydrate kinase [Anaerolineae bacterium]|mgnify:CR=1 FL=1|nr:FGGY family carbohydrate kinase [Anaerolineae bacterium]HMR64763.1 FGGY family carbohydrate kinase [Anaerolineae bacterium]
MSTLPLLAGVDVGTSSIKAIIFEAEGQVVAQASVPTPTHYPRPNWAYYDPEELWQATATALRQAIQSLPDTGRLASVAVASMGEAAVPIDAAGRPVYEAIAWFDSRTQPQVEWLDRAIGKDHFFAVSGLSLQPIFGLCKLLWIKENEPEAFARIDRWLNIADYIAYRLCGTPATDYSLASRTLALNLAEGHWAETLIQAVGLSPELFAPLAVSGTDLGSVTPDASAQTGLPVHARVGVGGHDHVCGALALGVTQPGLMLNSLGTAEAVFLPLAAPITDPRLGRQGYSQGAHVVKGHYYTLGGLYTSGASVEWWRDIIGEAEGYATLIAEAGQAPPGSLGAFFLPHLRLANPPFDDPKGRGAFIGLTADAKHGVLFRAILEGLAYESRHTLETLLTYPGVMPLQTIYATGGNSRNELLMQIKATVLNQAITVADVAEATSLGAAMLGGLAARVYADVPSALTNVRRHQRRVEPVVEQVPFYEQSFRQVYQRLYPTLRDLHHQIYQLQQSP